ncbi:hypothetical protein ANN_22618 [Periplaneta americana]|uniref:Per a allergen n=1 Tax=Periplaneta americana TaxID=6978 RepID=A0ABQ8S9K8_PERAM|nr:hypothetical protein ANN_22618 [Periplaneta americana]
MEIIEEIAQGLICGKQHLVRGMEEPVPRGMPGGGELCGVDLNLHSVLQVPEIDILDAEFTTDEVTKAISSLKNNKAPGIDGVSSEFLKQCNI